MCGFDGARAYVDGRAIDLVNFEQVESVAGTDDVSNGIDSTDFVEVDLVDGETVDSGFGFAEDLEDATGGSFDGSWDFSFVDELEDLDEAAMIVIVSLFVCVVMTMFVTVIVTVIVIMAVIMIVIMTVLLVGGLVADEDVELGGGDAVANGFFGFIFGTEAEVFETVDEFVGVGSGVDQCADGHVSAHAGEGVKVGYSHVFGCLFLLKQLWADLTAFGGWCYGMRFEKVAVFPAIQKNRKGLTRGRLRFSFLTFCVASGLAEEG